MVIFQLLLEDKINKEGIKQMKTVVITGSASGLWFEMAKQFRKNNYNVVISDVLEEKLWKILLFGVF